MHSFVGVIEAGVSPQEALSSVEEFLQSRLHSEIDYYILCNDENFGWRDYPRAPISIHSKEGEELVEELMGYTKKEIFNALEQIKAELKKEKPNYSTMFYLLRMAGGTLMNGYLFLGGDPVVSWEQIREAEKFLSPSERFYIVLADVHY